MVSQGLYLPRRHGEFLEVMIAIDTSGSIGNSELHQFLGEVEGILASCPSKVWLVWCDTTIGRVDEVTSDDLPLEVTPRGGGGTDFRPVFDYWKECEGSPSCLIYLTDLYGMFPDTEPDFPVLWVATPVSGGAPWGEVVTLE